MTHNSQPTKSEVARQFGRNAAAYASSPSGHGSDLERLLILLDLHPEMDVLDIATGAGHTAVGLAPLVKNVTAVDLAPEMIEETKKLARRRGVDNVRALVMDAESLEFPDASFDVVTCRIAPHHFPSLEPAISEMARVLKPGGRLGLEDSVVPEDRELNEFMNRVERLRDPTHVRSYTVYEWTTTLVAAGLEPTTWLMDRVDYAIAPWVERSGISPEAKERVYAAFADASPAVRDYFRIRFEDGRAVSFLDEKVIVRASKV